MSMGRPEAQMKSLHKKPKDGSTPRSLRRYFQLFGIEHHRPKNAKLSTGEFFVENSRALVGLNLSRPLTGPRFSSS